jgi:MFS transporter, DHA1 family, tetracycline resistance protein
VTNAQAGNQQPGAVLPRLPLAVLFFTLFAMAVSLSFVFAVLPPIGRGLGLSELQLGMVVAPAALVFVLANGIWGVLSERLGRKPVIVSAVTAAALASGACGWIIDARLNGNLSVSSQDQPDTDVSRSTA